MDNQLFRKKNVDKLSSPEQLNDYIKVSNPGVWMILGAIIVLLIGVCVWGIFGNLDTKLSVAMVVKDGKAFCYLGENDAASVSAGMPVKLDGTEYEIVDVVKEPMAVSQEMGDYFFHISGFSQGEWVYQAEIGKTELADGVYQAEIVIDSVSPMSFVMN